MKRFRSAGLIFVAMPAAALAFLIVRFGVDVPYWDEWSVIGFAEAFHLHVLSFSQLFSQYNEDRLFFPRLILLSIDALAHGNVKYEMLGTFLLAVLVMFNVFWLAKLTVPANSRWMLLFLASLLTFSPIQYENWLWGHQLSNLMPIACLTSALSIAYSNRGRWWSFGLAAALATIATFSYVNGMMCWILLVPVLLLRFKNTAEKMRAAAIWAALAAANLAAFFYHYRFPAGSHPNSLAAQKELVAMSFLSLAGGPISFGTAADAERVAHFAGAAILMLAVVAILRLVEVRKKAGLLWRALPWLAIGGFSLATEVLVTIGRATSSLQRLLESRYTAVSIYMMVALIFLWAIVFEDAHLRPWVGYFLASLLLILHLFTARYALGQMVESRTDRLQAKACLAFFDVIDDACQTQRLDWEADLLRQRVQSLQRLDYFHPRLVQSSDLRQIAVAAEPSSKEYGVFESLTSEGSGFYRAAGWAVLPERSEPADAVVFTYRREDSEPVAFALADWMKTSGGGKQKDGRSNWEKWLELPAGADRIQAWAYDALAGRAFPLKGEQRASSAPAANLGFVPRARGFVDSVKPGDPMTIGGWAVLLNQQRPADMVILTCGADRTILATGPPWSIRPDVARELRDARYLKSGWQISIPARRLPSGCDFSAWAYDAASNQAGLLPDLRRIQPNPR